MGRHTHKRKVWTPAEDRLLRELYLHQSTASIAKRFGATPCSTYQHAHHLGLRKTAEYMASPDACRLRRDNTAGIPFRFQKGIIPHNKGKRMPGYAPGRMAETQFRKGQHPHTYKPIGATRLMDGYLQRKVTDTGYPPRDWKGVHVLLWEEVHGPIPAGHILAFIDGDKTHIAIDNLELITRAERMRRNTIHNMPPALKQVIQLTGALKRKIRNRESNHAKEQNDGSPRPSLRNTGSAEGPGQAARY